MTKDRTLPDRRSARVNPRTRKLLRQLLYVVGLCLVAIGFGLSGPSGRDLSIATTVVAYGLAATGLGFLWGQVGRINLAHVTAFGAGAYTATIGQTHFDLGFLPAVFVAGAIGAISAALVSLFSFRVDGHYFIILTFAISQVAVVSALQLAGVTGGVMGASLERTSYMVAGIDINERLGFFYISAAVLLLALVLVACVVNSRWGTTLRTLRENEPLAMSIGSAVGVHRISAFAFSGFLGGLGGLVYVYHIKFIQPYNFVVDIAIIFLMMALLGGRRHLIGPIIGAAIYYYLPNFIPLSPNLASAAFGLILIVMILVRPDGLLGPTGQRAKGNWTGQKDDSVEAEVATPVVTTPNT